MTPITPDIPRRNTWLEHTPDLAPLPPRTGTERRADGTTAWDFGPPGVISVGPTVASSMLLVAMVLPLSIVGLASITWHDWPLVLRIFLGLIGLGGSAVSAFLIVWPFIFAAAFRERLLLHAGHLYLARGVGLFRRLKHLGPAAAFSVRTAPRAPGIVAALREPNAIGGHHPTRVALYRTPATTPTALVGTWLDLRTAAIARDRITRALQASPPPTDTPPPQEPFPLGWSITTIRSRVSQWWRARKADPAPLVFDIAALLGMAVGSWLPDLTPDVAPSLRDAYPVAAVIFVATLALRLRHPGPYHGLSPALGRPLATGFGFALAGVTVVIGCAMGPMLERWWSNDNARTSLELIGISLVTMTTAAILIGRMAYKRADAVATTATHPNALAPVVNVAFVASLVILTWVHEGWARAMLEDSQRGLGPLSLALLPTSMAVLVWPGRFFFQLEAPFDDGPRWGFVWLVGGFAFFALTGVR